MDILISGYDGKIFFIDISNLPNLKTLSSSTYNDSVSEPNDFKITKNKKILIFTNIVPSIAFVDIIDFSNTKLISLWDNIFKKPIYDIELDNND